MSKKTKLISKIIVLFVVLCAALSAVLLRDNMTLPAKRAKGVYYVARGDKALRDGNYQKAIDYYEWGLKLYPQHAQAECNLANILVMYENYEEAAKHYQTSLKYRPNDIVCRMNLGIVLSEKLMDYDEAIYEYNKVTNTPVPFISIPYFYANKKTARENQGLSFYNAGLAYRSKSALEGENETAARADLLSALEMYQDAIRILKKDYNTQYNLALTYHLLGDAENAQKNYCQAIEDSPLSYEAHYNLAVLLKNKYKYRESLDEFEKASLILDLEGNANISRYVFDILNEVYQRVVISEGGTQYLIEHSDKNFKQDSGITYIKGKMVVSGDFDKAMLKNFKTCAVGDSK